MKHVAGEATDAARVGWRAETPKRHAYITARREFRQALSQPACAHEQSHIERTRLPLVSLSNFLLPCPRHVVGERPRRSRLVGARRFDLTVSLDEVDADESALE